MTFFVYVLESEKDGSYYVGSTYNLEDRIERHNQGRSKYTKANRPWRLVYFENHLDRSSAMRREYAIKRRKSKEYINTYNKFPVFKNFSINHCIESLMTREKFEISGRKMNFYNQISHMEQPHLSH